MYKTRYNRIILPIFYLFDLIILISIYIINYYTIYVNFSLYSYTNIYPLLFITFWFLFSHHLKVVDIPRLINLKKYIINIIIIISINFLLTFCFLSIDSYDTYLTLLLKKYIIYSSLYIISANLIRYYYLHHYRSKGYNTVYCAAVLPEDFNGLSEIKSELQILGYNITKEFRVKNKNILPNIINYLKGDTINTIFFIHPTELPFLVDKLIDTCDNNGIRIKILPNYPNYVNRRIGLDVVAGYGIIDLRHEPLAYLHNRFIKRSLDIVFAVLSIIFVLSVLPIVIKIFQIFFDRGPLLFKQERIGKNGEIFTIYKFRTLKGNYSVEKYNVVGTYNEEAQKNDFETRITKFGQVLRKTNLDEYPQFINVLFGDMSVVGPRPILISSDDQLSSQIPKYKLRSFLKPGVTGWAQVNGYRGSIENQKNIRKRTELDIYYLENWTLFFDIKIIIITIWQMLTFSIPNAD